MNTEKDYFFRVGPNQTFIRGGDETHHLWTGPNPIYEFAEEGWCLDCSSFAVKRLQNAIEKGLIDCRKLKIMSLLCTRPWHTDGEI